MQYLNDYQQVFTSRGDYTNDIIIKTCIDVIAKHCAKLKAVHVVKEKGNKKPVTDSRLVTLLTLEPNPYMTAYDLQYKVAAQCFMNQNAYIEIQRDPSGRPIALWPLDYSTVEAVENDMDIYLKFQFGNGQSKTIPYADIIHIRNNFQDGELIAHTTDNLNDNLATLAVLQQSFENAAVNSGRIKGVAQVAGQVGSDAWAKKAKMLNDNLKNAETGGIVVTDATVNFTPCNGDPIPADHSQLDYIRENIYRYYGISENIVSNTYTEPEWQAFYESTIEPFAIRLSQEMTRKLFTPEEKAAGNEIIYAANRLTYATTKTKTELIAALRPLGILTTNQCLEIMNLPPVEDGDKRVQTLNVANTAIVDEYQAKGGDNDG